MYCTSKAVHVDLVSTWQPTPSFIWSFRCFAFRRGLLSRPISYNGNTFKPAAKLIGEILESSKSRKYFLQFHIKQQFKLERAPWWEGIFERMVKSAKRWLRKSVGKYCMSHDKLLALIIEVETVLNSRQSHTFHLITKKSLLHRHIPYSDRLLTLPEALLRST